MNYFTFDGVDSAEMGLYIAYFDKEVPNIATAGGKYDLITDMLPTNPKQIYYGKNYSAQPLEYTADILLENPTDNGDEDNTELWDSINDWLFGTDGYKKFYMGNTADYNYLTCVMIPVENLYIKGLQIGVRVLIHNDSPFWYKDKSITFDTSVSRADENGDITFNKTISSASNINIYPIIKFKPQAVNGGTDDYFLFRIQNIGDNEEVLSEFKTYIAKRDSNKDWIVDCRFMTITADGVLKPMKLKNTQPNKDWFYLLGGKNKIKINTFDLSGDSAPFQYLKMDYTQYIRKGEIIV